MFCLFNTRGKFRDDILVFKYKHSDSSFGDLYSHDMKIMVFGTLLVIERGRRKDKHIVVIR